KDTSKPVITSLYAYPIGEGSTINKSNRKQKLKLTPLKNGDYAAESVTAFGEIGFAINTFDRQDFGANSNGVYNIQTFINGSQNFEVDFRKFSFDETNRLNRFIDYEHFKTTKERIQKLFNDNNDLSLLKSIKNNGLLTIQDSTSVVYKIRVSDFK